MGQAARTERRERRVAPARAGLVALISTLALLGACALAPAAQGDTEFCPSGEGAGQCAVPGGTNTTRALATDFEDGRLYLADRDNNRVNVFAVDEAEEEVDFLFAFGWGVDTGAAELQSCTAASGCQAGIPGSGEGQFDRPVSVAVDNGPGGGSAHAVYVSDENERIQKFDEEGNFIWEEGGFATQTFVGVGPGGLVYAVDRLVTGEVHKQRLHLFEEDGTPVSQCNLFEVSGNQEARVRGLAVAEDGELWVASQGPTVGLRRYDTGCALQSTVGVGVGVGFGFALARAQTGEIYASQQQDRDAAPGTFVAIGVYDAAGEVTRRFAYDNSNPLGQVDGIAAFPSSLGDLFFSREKGAVYYAFEPPPGPVVPGPSVELDAIAAVKATVLAEVNPEGGAGTETHFEYLTEEEYLDNGETFAGAQSTPEEPLGAEDFDLHAVEAQIGCPDPLSEEGHPGETAAEAGECLLPETAYRWRIVATNADGEGEGTVEGPPFATLEAPLLGALYATGVGSDTARLHAELNPLGVPTTGWFEYVDEQSFAESEFEGAARVPDVAGGEEALDFGTGEEAVTRTAVLSGLQPGTTYRYRLVADSELLDEEAASEPRRLTTFAPPEAQSCANEGARIGAGALLPDCRAYEMVSPIDKEGGDIRMLRDDLRQLTALEQAAVSGGRLAYGSSRPFGDVASAPLTSQYIARRVAGEAWLSHPISIERGRGVVGAAAQFAREVKAFSEDLCRAWVETFAEVPDPPPGYVPGVRNLLLRHDRLCGEERYEALAPLVAPSGLGGGEFVFELWGLSADGREAILNANGSLAAGASSASRLYGASGGGLRSICVAPSGAAFPGACTAGTLVPNGQPRALPGTISEDGKRVFFSTGGSGARPLYVRANPSEPESPREHGAAYGTGDVIGEGFAKGRVLTSNPNKVTNVSEASGLGPGQVVSDSAGRIPAGTRIVECLPDCLEPSELVLDQAVTGNALSDEITGHPSDTLLAVTAAGGAFQAGQRIEGPGIPAGTTIEAVAEPEPGVFELTLSELASSTNLGAPLGAWSPCDRPLAGACTIAVSEAAATFWGAATDGSAAVFSTGALLGGKATLRSFDVESEEGTTIATRVFGVMGIGEDAERIYFASGSVEGGENSEGDVAIDGEPNLYLYQEGAGSRFIGTLADADLMTTTSDERYGRRNPRVSADGAHAAFVSRAPLSGYDNRQVGGGGACNPEDLQQTPFCSEVYRYDAAADELSCASCNPTGARPLGPARVPSYSTPLHASRVLSEDGSRLFFETPDRLASRDSNGRVDVYQWEQPDTGGCREESYDFSAEAEGCISLISSGQSPQDSRFVEADPSGDNVFFVTGSSLLPQDPGVFDIYDARVGGGLPTPEPAPPGCEGEACQSPPPAPADPTPASATFRGPGDLVATPAGKPCARPARRAKSLSRRAKKLRRGAERSKAPAIKRRRARVARRSARQARRLSRSAKRCRARARQSGGAGR